MRAIQRIATSMALSCVVAACNAKSPPTARAGTPTADAFSIRTATTTPDSEHQVAMPDRDGITWAVSTQPVADEQSVDRAKTRALKGPSGWGLSVAFQPAADMKLHEWSSAHIGKNCAVIVNGRLMLVAPLQRPLSSVIWIDGFAGETEARKAAARILD